VVYSRVVARIGEKRNPRQKRPPAWLKVEEIHFIQVRGLTGGRRVDAYPFSPATTSQLFSDVGKLCRFVENFRFRAAKTPR